VLDLNGNGFHFIPFARLKRVLSISQATVFASGQAGLPVPTVAPRMTRTATVLSTPAMRSDSRATRLCTHPTLRALARVASRCNCL